MSAQNNTLASIRLLRDRERVGDVVRGLIADRRIVATFSAPNLRAMGHVVVMPDQWSQEFIELVHQFLTEKLDHGRQNDIQRTVE